MSQIKATQRSLNEEEIRYLLDLILETLTVFDYPTPSVFSGICRAVLVSFWNGTGYPIDGVEEEAVTLFRQLNNYCYEHRESYGWFLDWSRRLSTMVSNRRVDD